jgi:tripartite-type tricarboxylate transporter receptor subunit TctC
MHYSRRAIALALFTGGIAASHAALLHAAEPYPARPVRLIVPFAPGGGTDIMARILGQKLTDTWKKQVVVDNRGGSGTIIGTELAVRSVADGYTIMLANIALALNPGLHERLPYDALKDLTPIILIASQPNAVAANPAFPPNSVKELIAYAKGKQAKLNFASSGSGGVGHISGEMFRIMIGADMVHIPYKGGGPAAIDVIAGHVPLAFISLPTVMSHMKAGRLKVLAITDSKRSNAAPNIPTVGESLPGFQVDNWIGMLAPAGTPRDIIARLNADILAAVQAADTRERLLAQGFDVQGGTPAQFAAVIKGDIEKYKKVIRTANIREE